MNIKTLRRFADKNTTSLYAKALADEKKAVEKILSEKKK